MKATPLNDVFESLSDGQSYIETDEAYAGQTIKVKTDDGKYHVYILQPSDSGYTLEEINNTSSVKQYVVIGTRPETNQEQGVIYIDSNVGYIWNGTEWQKIFEDASLVATAGSVAKAVKDASDAINVKIGDTEELDTTAKILVDALNEVRQSVSAGGTAAAITITSDTTTEGMAKSYTVKQGDSTVGVIDIPKDMVVSSGTVETDPEDQDPGTYIVLTLANATSDKIYINAGTLVDVYTAQQSAAQVQLTINSGTREISAVIVAGSITDVELAANAVTTVKIADGNVTKAKLASSVQSSLDSADTALQPADITTGEANGTIAVDGTDVSVKGLGSAAYVSTGAATGNVPVNGAALGTTANVPVVTNASGQLIPHASGALKSAAFAETTAFDAAGTAQSLVSALESGAVATNASDIDALEGRVDTLEGTTWAEISDEEIQALFA